jgi:hypothetical protein
MTSLLLFMFAGPLYRQLLGGRNTYLPRWVMFRNAAINLVQAKFFIEGADEGRLKLEPFDTNSPAPPHRIVGREELESIIAELRVEHRGQGGDALVVNARIAKHWGWKGIYEARRFELER